MSQDIKKYLVRFTQEEYNERNTANFEAIRNENGQDLALNAQRQQNFLEQRRQRDRELAAERKRRQREREKLLEIEEGIRKEDGTLIKRKVWLLAF